MKKDEKEQYIKKMKKDTGTLILFGCIFMWLCFIVMTILEIVALSDAISGINLLPDEHQPSIARMIVHFVVRLLFYLFISIGVTVTLKKLDNLSYFMFGETDDKTTNIWGLVEEIEKLQEQVSDLQNTINGLQKAVESLQNNPKINLDNHSN